MAVLCFRDQTCPFSIFPTTMNSSSQHNTYKHVTKIPLTSCDSSANIWFVKIAKLSKTSLI